MCRDLSMIYESKVSEIVYNKVCGMTSALSLHKHTLVEFTKRNNSKTSKPTGPYPLLLYYECLT